MVIKGRESFLAVKESTLELDLKTVRELIAHTGHLSAKKKWCFRHYDHLLKVNWHLGAAWTRSLVS